MLLCLCCGSNGLAGLVGGNTVWKPPLPQALSAQGLAAVPVLVRTWLGQCLLGTYERTAVLPADSLLRPASQLMDHLISPAWQRDGLVHMVPS